MSGKSHWMFVAMICVAICNVGLWADAPSTDATPIPIPELNCQIASASPPNISSRSGPAIRLFKPQQTGMPLPTTLDPNGQANAGANPGAGFGAPGNIPTQNLRSRDTRSQDSRSQTPPGFTGGLSDQRAEPRLGGPTTAKTTTRDKENWTPLLGTEPPATNRPSTRRVAAQNLFENQSTNGLPDQRNSLAAGQQQAPARAPTQPPLGANGQFLRMPGGVEPPNRDPRSANTFGVGFASNQAASPTGELSIAERLAQREAMLRQQQEDQKRQEAEKYVASIREQNELERRRQLMAQSTNPSQQNPNAQNLNAQNPNAQNLNAQALNTQAANSQSASDPFRTPFDPARWNQQNGVGIPNNAASQASNPFPNGYPLPTGQQNQSTLTYPRGTATGANPQVGATTPGYPNPANYPGGVGIAKQSPQVVMGMPQTNANAASQTTSAVQQRRDVDPMLSPADVARLPRNAYSFDDWGNPVTKGGHIVDKLGRFVSKQKAFELTYGSELVKQQASQPSPNNPGMAGAIPNQTNPGMTNVGGRQVNGMPPIPSPSDVGLKAGGAGRRLDGLDNDPSQTKESRLLPPKTRSLAAQGFLNILLLVSVIGNLYMVIWFQKMWGRYRDLIASQRAMSSPGALAD